MDEQQQDEYAIALGDRLRNVRQQQGLSLHDVERRSHGELKASVVGAYERGERAVSVPRLRTLASFYNVPIAELLPRGDRTVSRGSARGRLRIDLTRLDVAHDTDAVLIGRFIDTIRVRRGDYNGRTLTLRSEDLNALAAVLDRDPTTLRESLVSNGVAEG